MQLSNDDEAAAEFGIEYATRQCEELLRAGVPGLHFYTLNKSRSTIQVLKISAWREWTPQAGIPPDSQSQLVRHDADNTQRPGVFQIVGGLVQLLQRELGVVVKVLVVDEFADGAIARC